MNVQHLSASGRKWVATMGRIYTSERIAPIISRAARVASERGGRVITRDDLNEAVDLIAQQELVRACMNEVVWE